MDQKKESGIIREIGEEAREGARDALRYAIKAEEALVGAVGVPEKTAENEEKNAGGQTARRYLHRAPLAIPTAASMLRSLRDVETKQEAARGRGSSPQAGPGKVLSGGLDVDGGLLRVPSLDHEQRKGRRWFRLRSPRLSADVVPAWAMKMIADAQIPERLKFRKPATLAEAFADLVRDWTRVAIARVVMEDPELWPTYDVKLWLDDTGRRPNTPDHG
jgi:hypothetical protein